MVFFGRNDNILHIFLKSYQRAGFDIIISTVSYKIFYKLPCSGILLHLIKYDEGLAPIRGVRKNDDSFAKNISRSALSFAKISSTS